MKKIYTLAALSICMVVGTNAIGQNSGEIPEVQPTKQKLLADDRYQPQERPTSTFGSTERAEVVIYSEDFDGELPSDWNSVVEAGPCDWAWTDSGPAGPSDWQTLASTTADNGWMILDSDLCGAEGGDAEDVYLNSPSYDLSGYDFVAFRFEQYFQRYGPAAEITSVEVSIDGGTEWTEYIFNDDVESGGETENPAVIQQNIGAIAGGESDVQFRFHWQGTWGYGWQIDDFAIVVPSDNDLSLSNVNYNKYVAEEGNDYFFYSFLEYSIYPVDQILPMFFNAEIENIGGAEQTNVQLEVTISDGSGVIATVTSDPVTIAPTETHYAEIEYTPPAVLGDYQLDYNVTMAEEDENPNNNMATKTFSISEDEFARDNGIFANASTAVLEAGADARIAIGYYFSQDAEVHCIGAAIHEASYGPLEIKGAAYDEDEVAVTQTINVEDAELNNLADEPVFTWLPFVDFDPFGGGEEEIVPFPVTADDEWLFAIEWTPQEIDGDPEDIGVVYIGYGTDPALDGQSVFVWGPQSTEGNLCDPCNAGTTPYMIRLGMSAEFCGTVGVGIEEVENLVIDDLFPNPTSGQTTLSYSLLETAKVQVFLFDAQGRVVMNDDLGTQPVGEYRFDYDFSDKAAGMYTMSIKVGDQATNKKLVIK